METHSIVTTLNALTSAGASFEAAALGVTVSAHMERATATPTGIGFRGMTLPHGDESAWPAFYAALLGPKGGVSLYTAIPPVGEGFPDTPLTSNVNSTPCQSRGRNYLT
jgi:hypothetical protein